MVLGVEEFGFFYGILFSLSTLVIFVCMVNVRMHGSTPQVILLMLYGIIMLTFGLFRLWVRENANSTSSVFYIVYRAFIAMSSVLCVRPYPILRFSGHKTIRLVALGMLVLQFAFGMTGAILGILNPLNPWGGIFILGLLGSLLITSGYTWYCQFKIYKMIMNSPMPRNDVKMQRIKSVSAYGILSSMVVYLLSVVLAISPTTGFLVVMVQMIQTLLFAVSDLIIMTNKGFTQVQTKMSDFSAQ